MHYKLPVLGFRIENFAYITDAKTIDINEKKKLKNLDLLIVNALRVKEHLSHFNLKEAISLIKELEPKKAILTHISHFMGLHDDVQSMLPENIFVGYDNQKIIFKLKLVMRIDIISAVPSLLESPFNDSILKRAQEKK